MVMQQKNTAGYMDYFPNSKKIYIQGKQTGVSVACREVGLSPTVDSAGTIEENHPIRIYDTSGPWTDSKINPNVNNGLELLRGQWIEERKDSEICSGRNAKLEDNGHKNGKTHDTYPRLYRKRRCAKPGGVVTQMYYARKGIITPEMEYVALRESLGLDKPHVTNSYSKRWTEYFVLCANRCDEQS